MPFVFDFKTSIGEIHSVEVNPIGWKSPLIVEYIVAQAHRYDTMRSIVWRVKGTEHCFTIEEQRLNILSGGNYKEHFKKALEGFRKDYLSWFVDDEYKDCQWKYEYEKQFGKLILPEEQDNKR